MNSWLDNKFGFSYSSYLVYFSPLINGAHSTRGYRNNGFNQTVMFIARAEYDDNLSKIQNELAESRIVFTEIDHNYVNPVSDKFLEKINKALSNREVWAKPTITDAYDSPYKLFNEYMTFAIYSLYLIDNYSENDVKEYLPLLNKTMTDIRGFIKFEDFNDVLIEKYKQNKSISMPDLYVYMLDWCAQNNK